MRDIPRPALWLGLAGLIPFVLGALLDLVVTSGASGPDSYPLFAPTDGHEIAVSYGIVILAFMSGVLWGFAAHAPASRAPLFYALSVVPALWVFFTVSTHVFRTGGVGSSPVDLIAGFLGLLALDWFFSRAGLTPGWWMRLRILLTVVVVLCLFVVEVT